MIPRQPEPPAPPGIITPPPGPLRRIGDLLRRYRWELLPLYVAVPIGTAIELHAATNPGWETPLFYSTSGLGLGAVAYLARANKPAAFGLGSAAGACQWATAVTAGAPTVPALIVGTAAAIGASTQYWRLLGAKREEQVKRDHAVELARLKVIEAHAGARRIPGQREAPALETVPAADTRTPGNMPVVPWPGIPARRSITDPIALSPTTSITLPGSHALLGGATDFGKSGLIHLVCCNVLACPDAVLMGIDMKPGGVELGIYRHAGTRIATTGDDALRLLEDVRAEGKRRGDLLGVTVHPDGNLTLKRKWTPTPDGPQWVVVIDELAELVDEVPDAADLLRSHTRLLRAMGITIVSGCQITSRRVFGGDTDGRTQYGIRACVKAFDASMTNMIMGQGMHGAGIRPDQLKAPGEFVLIDRAHDGRTPDRAYLLDDQAIAGHVRRHATGRPAEYRDAEPEAFTARAEPAFETTGSTTGDILKYLSQHTAAPIDVAKATGRNKDSVRAIMSKLANDGKLITLGDGRYKAAKQGAAIAGNIVQFRGRRNA